MNLSHKDRSGSTIYNRSSNKHPSAFSLAGLTNARLTRKKKDEMENIAIIGSGMAGVGCAHFLQHRFRIDLYEQNNHVGGHANSVSPRSDRSLAIDTGFAVFYSATYPNITRLFTNLRIEMTPVEMSSGNLYVADSREFFEKISAPFRDRIRLNCGVRNIVRDRDRVRLYLNNGSEKVYDKVIVACYVDRAGLAGINEDGPVYYCGTNSEMATLEDSFTSAIELSTKLLSTPWDSAIQIECPCESEQR